MYEAGEWMAPVPPVPTTMWNKYDWIKWIGDNGDWGPIDDDDMACKECGGDGCGECMGDYEDDVRFDTTAERDDFYNEIERDR